MTLGLRYLLVVVGALALLPSCTPPGTQTQETSTTREGGRRVAQAPAAAAEASSSTSVAATTRGARPALSITSNCEGWNTQEFFRAATATAVRNCLAAGVDVNARHAGSSYTPLHYAARFSANPAVIAALVEAGADVNARSGAGYTPLHNAAQFADDPAVIAALLDAGADTTARNAYGLVPWDYARDREELKGTHAYQRLATRTTVTSRTPTPVVAAADCEGWNTQHFFTTATLAEVRSCLAAGADVNAQTAGTRYTPLHYAARFSDSSAIITALVAAGADTIAQDNRGNTPWDYAKDRGELQGSDAYQRLAAQAASADCAGWDTWGFFKQATLQHVRGCLAAGVRVNIRDSEGQTPLHRAAVYAADPAIIRALVGAGAAVNARDDNGLTPLHNAATVAGAIAGGVTAGPNVIGALVAAGADVNARADLDTTPLHFAALRNPNPAVITALANAGADVNAWNEFGTTPLHLAAQENDNPAVIRALANAGAWVNARARDGIGDTPLHRAARHNANPGIITALAIARAEANARNASGFTPLHLAVVVNNDDPAIIRALIAAGANVNARDAAGITPLTYAYGAEANSAVIAALLAAGAEIGIGD